MESHLRSWSYVGVESGLYAEKHILGSWSEVEASGCK